MKLKKSSFIFLLAILFVLQFSWSFIGNAFSKTIPTFRTSMTKTSLEENLYPGSEFEVTARIHDLETIENGLVIISGQIEYDESILEKISMEAQNDWDISLNEKNQKFIADNKQNAYVTEEGAIFKLKFKVKDTITASVKTTIALKNMSGSNGDIDISSSDAQVEIDIKQRPDGITSEKYVIEENIIWAIAPNTTVNIFKNNVETYQNMIFTDKNGNTLRDDSIIGTGMRLQVGTTLNFTLIVTGDIDGNGEINITDLSELKLHHIEKTLLTGAKLKAADVDKNGEITITDLAQLKLVLIGMKEIL